MLQFIKQAITNPQQAFGDIANQDAMINALKLVHFNQNEQVNVPVDMNANESNSYNLNNNNNYENE